MPEPLVSILINNYNYGRYLGVAIDSALAQTYGRVEVVVVDDGSTDDSREVITGFAERVVSVLKINGGQPSCQHHRVVVGHIENARAQLDLFRLRGYVRERIKRIQHMPVDFRQ